ncbi:MAG: FKBP-type peptidyl-prolyl cis-trans isomerase [Bacteroidota bacterium]
MIKIKRKMVLYVVVLSIIVFISACLGTEKNEKKEEEKIKEFLLLNPDLIFELKPSGLYYLDIKVGSGVQPVIHDTAYIFYIASLLDNRIFDSNTGTTDTLIIPVNEGKTISGFDEAITYMRAGGKSLFIVPSYIGYGQTDISFPAYTPILYEVDLVRVKAGPGDE